MSGRTRKSSETQTRCCTQWNSPNSSVAGEKYRKQMSKYSFSQGLPRACPQANNFYTRRSTKWHQRVLCNHDRLQKVWTDTPPPPAVMTSNRYKHITNTTITTLKTVIPNSGCKNVNCHLKQSKYEAQKI